MDYSCLRRRSVAHALADAVLRQQVCRPLPRCGNGTPESGSRKSGRKRTCRWPSPAQALAQMRAVRHVAFQDPLEGGGVHWTRKPWRLGALPRPGARLPVRRVVPGIVAIPLVVAHALRRRGDDADRSYHGRRLTPGAWLHRSCTSMEPGYALSSRGQGMNGESRRRDAARRQLSISHRSRPDRAQEMICP